MTEYIKMVNMKYYTIKNSEGQKCTHSTTNKQRLEESVVFLNGFPGKKYYVDEVDKIEQDNMRIDVRKESKGVWIAECVLGDGSEHIRRGTSRVDSLQHLQKHLEIVKGVLDAALKEVQDIIIYETE